MAAWQHVLQPIFGAAHAIARPSLAANDWGREDIDFRL
jgi:hypothetical protein